MNNNIKYPNLEQLYYFTPQSGALIEGRQHRKGRVAMKCSTYTRYHKVENFRTRTIIVPEIPNFPVREYSYEVTIRTFPLLDSLGPIRRYDTVAFWDLSFQEILRHLALAPTYVNSDMWGIILDVIASYKDEIVEVFDKYFKNILSMGDMSIEHFELYVKEHKDSASPFGPKWGYYLEKPGQLKIAHERTNRAIEDFVKNWKMYIKPNVFINPAFCYPALRARPGEPTIISKSDSSITVLMRKWRDRKAGGVSLLSQLTYPIFKKECKKDVEACFYEFFKRVLGCEIHALAQDGPKVYKDIVDHDLFLYDVRTAEKQIGLAFKWLPFSVDLGHPKFDKDNSSEVYSGIGPTRPLNATFLVMMLKAYQDQFGLKFQHLAIFSDNFGVDKELPKSPHFEVSETFCGFLKAKKTFGPVSLCTDNPNHRINFGVNKNRLVQTQGIQYFVRPLLAVVMNGVANYGSTMKFLDFVIENEIFTKPEFHSGPKDALQDAFMAQTKVHEKFVDKFATDLEWVSRWFPMQKYNPDYVAELSVY